MLRRRARSYTLTRPLRTIGEPLRRAQATLGTSEESRDVYVAGGVYVETIHLLDGERVHGGYRGDYLKRDIGGYEVIVVAAALTTTEDDPQSCPALLARDFGFLP